MQAVTKSTKAWVENFVLRYDLCPFAESVFSSKRVRYRAFLSSDIAQIKNRLRYEVSADFCHPIHSPRLVK